MGYCTVSPDDMGYDHCVVAAFGRPEGRNSFDRPNKAAIALVTSLDALVIEALYEWEGVFGGQFSNEEITDRRRKLMQLRHEAEVEHLPTADLPERQDLLELAEGDAIAYFETMFGPFETILGPRE